MHQNRIFGLDILRSIAILTVIYGHIYYMLPNNVDPISRRLFFFDGVNIFFVLSGFLIGGILLKTLSKNPATIAGLTLFWKNRWWRTLPLYFFILTLLIAVSIIHHPEIIKDRLKFYVFLQNMQVGNVYWFGESWSLSVEEWFYITTPLLLFFACRFIPVKKAVPLILIVILLIANIIRVIKVNHNHIDTYDKYVVNILMAVPTRIDAIMFGVIGAYLSFYNFTIWRSYKNILFYIGVAGFFINHYYGIYLGFNNYILYFHKNVEAMFILFTLPKLSAIKGYKGLIGKVITFISIISYSIYLVHATMYLYFVRRFLPEIFLFQLPFYLIWAFAGATVLHYTVEKWGMIQRDKFRKGTIKPVIR